MSKPDDIESLDLKWRMEANKAIQNVVEGKSSDGFEIICRAIMAAKDEERAECAKMANIEALKNQDIADGDGPGMIDTDRYRYDAIAEALDDLAEQIRSRS